MWLVQEKRESKGFGELFGHTKTLIMKLHHLEEILSKREPTIEWIHEFMQNQEYSKYRGNLSLINIRNS